ncbi:uncharacterized protein SPPG_04836 [Spizellomyces punctatus DAOM BR117]|uniref:Uncharacterized protein n=1 Tax=Spizellomyces punctatus (strain DAOM BR117) TaxID=645134 RepID=A0A0L0HGB5_SPIPD|nr:uncharacterized protein SPPG_04836 [Spizellomyces punctatus DAOM BR117]KND00526.1 hypothetical protein SPPG_04836 [Spizellomyces punctatus DAOM BR117]|eukprot:XP_016608565.1 hypothetical protein SPPG_04836 [Spizellomyces punctatus DAOM BR117]
MPRLSLLVVSVLAALANGQEATSIGHLGLPHNMTLGLISFQNDFIELAGHGQRFDLQCGTLLGSTNGRMWAGPETPLEMSKIGTGSVEVDINGSQLCFRTNSTRPCVIKSVNLFNETHFRSLADFPRGSIFDDCYERGIITVKEGHKPCINLRFLNVCSGLALGFGMRYPGSDCTQAFQCVPESGEYLHNQEL